MEAISREGYLAFAGHKKTAEFQPIYDQYEGILGDEALELTLDMFRSSAEQSDDKRSARSLLEWEIESQASKSLASLDEREIAWENSAIIRSADGRMIQYQAAPIEIANTHDRKQRLALDAARAALVKKEHAPLRRERLQREKDYIESLGVADDYNSSFETVNGISLTRLAQSCERFLRDTQAMWDDTLPGFLRKSLGIKPSQAKRSDALALFRASEYDDAFPGNHMESVIRRNVSEMGIDPSAKGRIIFDVGDREGKRSRAFCSPVRVPEEVYLVLRPHGGQSDYNTFLHELGHALHFAYASADYPFEFRWLGDNSVTEAYAMLFDHRCGIGDGSCDMRSSERTGWRRFCAHRASRSCTSCVATARSSCTRRPSTAERCHGRSCRISTCRFSRTPRGSNTTLPTPSWMSTRGSTPRGTCAPGSCSRCSMSS